MKKNLIMLLSLVCVVSAMAQKPKVAVYITGEQSGVTKVLGDQLVAAFSKSSEYKAVERTSSFLAEISKEQGYQRTGAVDDKEISRLGKQFGVQFVCVADISEAFGKKYVSARLINVENAEIVNAANEYSDLNSMKELIRVSDALNGQLLGTNVVRSKVVSVEPGYTDLGLPSGMIWKNDNATGFYTYDEAVSLFGDRLPTREDFEELKAECQWSYTGSGYKITGPNGNSIILPAAGRRGRGSVYSVGSIGDYWSSTPDGTDRAWSLSFSSYGVEGGTFYRANGCSVRLVQKK